MMRDPPSLNWIPFSASTQCWACGEFTGSICASYSRNATTSASTFPTSAASGGFASSTVSTTKLRIAWPPHAVTRGAPSSLNAGAESAPLCCCTCKPSPLSPVPGLRIVTAPTCDLLHMESSAGRMIAQIGDRRFIQLCSISGTGSVPACA